MASITSAVFSPAGSAPYQGLSQGGRGSIHCGKFSSASPIFTGTGSAARRRSAAVVVRAEAINPEIRKSEEKVVDSVVLTDLSKPLTAYCRCWRSKTFPLCDGSHVKHNKANGDNVGPLLLKKQ